MSLVMSLKTNIDQILSGRLTFGELEAFVKKGNAFERINAIKQVSKQFPSREAVVLLEAAAQETKNNISMLGRTIKAVAIAGLISVNRKDATEVARRIIHTLSPNEAHDLAFHLQSEKLRMP